MIKENTTLKNGFNKTVIIFIDILGSQDRKDFDDWYRIMQLFNESVKEEKELDSSHPWTVYKREIHMFSDCAYIIYDFKEGVDEHKKDINALMCIACYNTEKLIYTFLKNGFIVRGAITYGEIFYDNESAVWFGPGMNRAYFLEAKMAKYPRIIIDPDYAQGLIAYNEKVYLNDAMTREINGEIIKKDTDELYYLNYLNSIYYYPDADETAKKIFDLCQIERNKKRTDEHLTLSIKEKYDWLEKYLNNYYEMQ